MRFGGDQQLTKCRGAFHAIDDARFHLCHLPARDCIGICSGMAEPICPGKLGSCAGAGATPPAGPLAVNLSGAATFRRAKRYTATLTPIERYGETVYAGAAGVANAAIWSIGSSKAKSVDVP